MRTILSLAGFGLLAGQVAAADVDVRVELPRKRVAEYHRPYVAVWVARPDHSVVANLAVWYQQHDGPEGEGTTWLKDLRQWWRRTGRRLDLPVDGVTGPTKAPGEHHVTIPDGENPFMGLPAGEYVLHVEAAREVGGRELLRIPFSWPGEAEKNYQVTGTSELGSVTLKFSDEK